MLRVVEGGTGVSVSYERNSGPMVVPMVAMAVKAEM
jgi:hypothetical protein